MAVTSSNTIAIQIREHLAATIAGITTDAGYNVTVLASTTGIYVDQHDSARQPSVHTSYTGTDYVGRDTPVQTRYPLARFVIRADVKDSTDPEAKADLMAVDIAKAFAVDISRGGLAIDTKILRTELHLSENGWATAWIEVTVEFRQSFGAAAG